MRLLPVIVAVVLALVVVSGITLVFTGALFPQKDPVEVLEDSIVRSNSVKDYDIEYDIKNVVTTDVQDVDIEGRMQITQSGTTKRIVYDMELLGSPSTIEIYQSPNSTITCSSSFGERQCLEIPTSPPVQSPVEQQEQLKKQLEDEAVSLAYLSQLTVIGRSCDSIRAVYDLQRLIETVGLDDPTTDAIKSMTLDVCVDAETGLPLMTTLEMQIDSPQAAGTVKTELIATSFSLTAEEIEIPEATQDLFANIDLNS